MGEEILLTVVSYLPRQNNDSGIDCVYIQKYTCKTAIHVKIHESNRSLDYTSK